MKEFQEVLQSMGCFAVRVSQPKPDAMAKEAQRAAKPRAPRRTSAQQRVRRRFGPSSSGTKAASRWRRQAARGRVWHVTRTSRADTLDAKGPGAHGGTAPPRRPCRRSGERIRPRRPAAPTRSRPCKSVTAPDPRRRRAPRRRWRTAPSCPARNRRDADGPTRSRAPRDDGGSEREARDCRRLELRAPAPLRGDPASPQNPGHSSSSRSEPRAAPPRRGAGPARPRPSARRARPDEDGTPGARRPAHAECAPGHGVLLAHARRRTPGFD